MKRFMLFLVSAMLLTSIALADTSFSGTVTATYSQSVLAPADGTLAAVNYQVGDRVAEGAAVAELLTDTVYAKEDGTVYVFGSEGAELNTINEQYGAVLYILPDSIYTLTVSTKNAYDAEANKRILPGEKVYIRSTSDETQLGEGTVTGVSGANYLVNVTLGDFNNSKAVNIYRSSDFDSTSRIGKGTVSYTGVIGYTGTGEDVSIGSSTNSSSNTSADSDDTSVKSLDKILVQDGQHVVSGTPLFTVSTSDGYEQAMVVSEKGIVAAVNATAGSAVTKGMSVMDIYPNSAMRLALSVSEENLSKINLGSTVTIAFVSGETAHGTLESIQGHVEEPDEDDDDDESFFTVYVAFAPTDTIAYGMTGTVTITE